MRIPEREVLVVTYLVSRDVRECLGNKVSYKRNTNFLFIGDSQARDLFTSMAAYVKPGYGRVPEDSKSATLNDITLGINLVSIPYTEGLGLLLKISNVLIQSMCYLALGHRRLYSVEYRRFPQNFTSEIWS